MATNFDHIVDYWVQLVASIVAILTAVVGFYMFIRNRPKIRKDLVVRRVDKIHDRESLMILSVRFLREPPSVYICGMGYPVEIVIENTSKHTYGLVRVELKSTLGEVCRIDSALYESVERKKAEFHFSDVINLPTPIRAFSSFRFCFLMEAFLDNLRGKDMLDYYNKVHPGQFRPDVNKVVEWMDRASEHARLSSNILTSSEFGVEIVESKMELMDMRRKETVQSKQNVIINSELKSIERQAFREYVVQERKDLYDINELRQKVYLELTFTNGLLLKQDIAAIPYRHWFVF